MLAQLYEGLPEVGDVPKPKLAFFFDEAHLFFDDASEALLEQIERTARLIRSKGVGVYFVTQAPTDVPSSVLAQLGNRVQHALRAFTPDDADALKKTARTFPVTEHYDVERTITSLGIGEALVTVLSPKGVPTPLAATRLLPPDSRMAPLTEAELAQVIGASQLNARYGTAVDRESAHEIISGRLANAKAAAEAAATQAGATVPGGATMTQAQYERAVQKQAKEQAAKIERERKEAERAAKARQREAAAAERQRQKTIETGMRTAGRVATSRLGQSILRGVFDTIFGGGRGR
jgi:DNA helicase HerA-like ATPase